MELTYLGTAMLVIEHEGTRLLTDPVLDPPGTRYALGPDYLPRGWFATEKRYATPSLGPAPFDAVLLSHDHHADNLDTAGRALVQDRARVGHVLTTAPGARRLGDAIGLEPGQARRIGAMTVRATPALHGPRFVPQTGEVIGFVVDIDHGPRIWISGDTVLHPALAATLVALRKERPVDVAVVHCGAVRFPRVPLLGRARFTFDAAEAKEACRLLAPKQIVPIHRSGWAHFQEDEARVFEAFADEPAVRLELGETLRV